MAADTEPPLGGAARLVGFDGLRAIAVLAVASYHFFLTVAVFPEERSWDVGQQARVGVWVFFILSGFLLYRPFAAVHAGQGGQPAIGRYAESRFLRIFPAYAAALIVLTYVWHKLSITDAGSFAIHLTLTQNYFADQFLQGIGPAWSLVVEVAFYTFLPIYAWVVSRAVRRFEAWRTEVVGLALLAVIGLGFQLYTVDHGMLSATLPGFLPTFAIGMFLAVTVVHGRDLGLPLIARHGGWCWFGALAVMVLKGVFVGADSLTEGFHLPNQLGYSLIAALLVLPAVYGEARNWPNRVLRSWPFHRLGVISYGVFLWSAFVIKTVQWEWIPRERFFGRSALVALVSFVATVAIATASWVLVERPALSLKSRGKATRPEPARASGA